MSKQQELREAARAFIRKFSEPGFDALASRIITILNGINDHSHNNELFMAVGDFEQLKEAIIKLGGRVNLTTDSPLQRGHVIADYITWASATCAFLESIIKKLSPEQIPENLLQETSAGELIEELTKGMEKISTSVETYKLQQLGREADQAHLTRL